MAAFALRVKTKTGQVLINNLQSGSTIKELKHELSIVTKIETNRLNVLTGYPPKSLDITNESKSLSESGLKSGETLIVEEKPVETTIHPKIGRTNSTELLQDISNQESCSGILLKKIVPADNSCLFSSIHFVLNRKIDESGSVAPWLRTLVAETIMKESDTYSEAILGKPVEEYCAWIRDDKSWGGAIELAIFANYYGIEIAVVDTINAIINRFGEDQHYPHRVFLMFDGIHYDPLYMENFDGSDSIRTIFPSDADHILKEAEQLAVEAKNSKQFTDVNKFTLQCKICNVFLKGQIEAQEHAKLTGHTNFGEV